ncbi:cytochrome P450 [Sinosporangium siamense]|uniref:Cytochrome P450 n=1 Tax=Sinosporangium siamense TaxID=1367973 RepID=A0A919RDR3_9ACTN|nr:cytochrome P450 [Sinosporangium siamense]GII91557.1 hypothetical protein Ssi02_17880 [Sinosporangium siamense]
MHHAVPVFAEGVMLLSQLPASAQRLPLPFIRRFHAAIRDLQQILDEGIAHRQAHPREDGNSLIDFLLSARDGETGTSMDTRQIRHESIGIFTAGVNSTSAVLAIPTSIPTRSPSIRTGGCPNGLDLSRSGHYTTSALAATAASVNTSPGRN